VAGAVDAAGETVTVFRVQGGTPPLASRQLITIDANGNPVISRTTLNISVGDPVHAEYFLSKRPGADITSFDVPKWMGDFIDEQAIPQAGYRTNPANQGGLAPKLVDPTTPGRAYELPDIWAKWLEEVAVPGSGKVTKGGNP
jgi:filamentous hemagglutinin